MKGEIKISDFDIKYGNRYCFTDRILRIEHDINIDNYHDKHANSVITITSKFHSLGNDKNHVNKIMEEMSQIYAKLIKQYKFNSQ